MDNLTNSSVNTNGSGDDYDDDYYDEKDCWLTCTFGTYLTNVTFIVGLILTVVLMLMTKRKRLCLGCLNGYFALIVPVNFLEDRTKRRVIVAVCAIITLDIMDVIVDISEFGKGQPRIFKIFGKMVMVAVISVKYLPLLRCVHVTSILTYLIGLLFTVTNIATAFVDMKINLDLELPLITLIDDLLVRVIILSIAGVYITYWFIKRIIKLLRGKFAKDNLGKYEIKYVKRILVSQKKLPVDLNASTLANKSKLRAVRGWLKKHIYHNVPGFKYSLIILVSCTVGFIGITKLAIESIIGAVQVYYDLSALSDYYETESERIPNFVKYIIQYINNDFDENDDDDDEIKVSTVMRIQFTVLIFAALLSVTTAYVLSAVLICRLLVNYRDNVLNLYKRKSDQAILRVAPMSNVTIAMSAMQFLGYQIAYLISGYVVQSAFLALAFIVILEVILFPMQFAFKAFLYWMLNLILPILFVIIVIKGTQYLLVRFAFLEDNGKTLALTNRRGYFITMYFVFFYNVFTGFVSCIVRILKCSLIGVIMVPRLDSSLFPNWFAKYDSGFKEYSCLLHLEALQCNPILRTFVYILLKKYIDVSSTGTYSSERILLAVSFNEKTKNKILARNRWFVAVTLIRNPVLVHERAAKLKKDGERTTVANGIVNNGLDVETVT